MDINNNIWPVASHLCDDYLFLIKNIILFFLCLCILLRDPINFVVEINQILQTSIYILLNVCISTDKLFIPNPLKMRVIMNRHKLILINMTNIQLNTVHIHFKPSVHMHNIDSLNKVIIFKKKNNIILFWSLMRVHIILPWFKYILRYLCFDHFAGASWFSRRQANLKSFCTFQDNICLKSEVLFS